MCIKKEFRTHPVNPPPPNPHPSINMGEVVVPGTAAVSFGLWFVLAEGCSVRTWLLCCVLFVRVLRRDLQSKSLTWSALQAYSDSQSHPVAARQAGRVIGRTDLYSNDFHEKKMFWIGGDHSRTRPWSGESYWDYWGLSTEMGFQAETVSILQSFCPFDDARVSRAALSMLSREMHRVMLVPPQLGVNRSVWVLHSFLYPLVN